MLSTNAKKIFKMKYAVNKEESWADACLRVASFVASVEEDSKKEREYSEKFFQLMYNRIFIPGGRILANAGTGIKNLNNCFVLPIDDSRRSIYQALKDAAEIFAWGGGIGYNFSNLREKDAQIKTTGGSASGPLSFMNLFDNTGEVISQASRRGAQMGILDCDHPDILDFINFKSTLDGRNTRLSNEFKQLYYKNGGSKIFDEDLPAFTLKKILLDNQLTHFNISVLLTDSFMNAVSNNEDWNLISRYDNSIHTTVPAIDILNLISKRAWESGDPGIFFYDRTNEDNLLPSYGDINVTNPCGEIGLLSYEPCCLGSINLYAIYKDGTIDWELLEFVVRSGVRFLDNVQELSFTPIPEINEISKAFRRIGLGVMGWADLLIELGIPYNSVEAYDLAEYISWFISNFAWQESRKLAEERGAFPFYYKFPLEEMNLTVIDKCLNSRYSPHRFDSTLPVRNISVTAIAPTGTIALIADVNSSIEPLFALAYKRNITEGVGNKARENFNQDESRLLLKLSELEYDEKSIELILDHVKENGNLSGCNLVPEKIKNIFKTSHEIDYREHINMQSAWQKYVTNSVSKTINMNNDSTIDDVYNAFFYMWKSGLKGGTIYRDGSKSFQILNKGNKMKAN